MARLTVTGPKVVLVTIVLRYWYIRVLKQTSIVQVIASRILICFLMPLLLCTELSINGNGILE